METALLTIEKVLGRSVVTASRGQGPLKLLTPKNHGEGAWVYQSSLGGGFVREDEVALRVTLAAGALGFLSSQAAGKVYRRANSRFTLEAELADDATLIVWPDPLMSFAGSRLTQVQHFRLESSASLLLVDSISAGRVASGERWAMEGLVLSLDLERCGERVFADTQRMEAAHGSLAKRSGGYDAFSTVVLTGPRFTETIERLDEAIRATPLERAPTTLLTASKRPWGLVVRLAASSTSALQRALHQLVGGAVAETLGDDPWRRKW